MDKLENLPSFNYSEISNKCIIKSGDILLCAGNTPFSKIVQNATESPWSHIGIIWKIQELSRLLVLESIEGIGGRGMSLYNYANNYELSGQSYPGTLMVCRHKEMIFSRSSSIIQEAIDLLGCKYNNQEIVKIGEKVLGNKIGLPVEPIYKVPSDTFICSEFVYKCFQEIGINIKYNKLGFIAPSDFAVDPNIEHLCYVSPEPALETT